MHTAEYPHGRGCIPRIVPRPQISSIYICTVGANESERSEKKLQIDMKTEEKSNLYTYNDKF